MCRYVVGVSWSWSWSYEGLPSGLRTTNFRKTYLRTDRVSQCVPTIACSLSPPRSSSLFGLYKILFIHFHFEALLHNRYSLQTPPLYCLCNINHYIAQYYQLLHPPRQF